MARKKIQTSSLEITSKFIKQDTMIIDGFEVNRGDIIKVRGEYGGKFKFDYFVTNSETGSQWVDCFEVQRGMSGCYRAFKIETIKRVPKKRGRSKRVARTGETLQQAV